MGDTVWDAIIVGRGLAGTTLAWHLQDAGLNVLVIDAEEAVTASKIAAGLITPITGKRLALSPRFEAFLAAARAFYGAIEKRTGGTFLHERVALRLFSSDEERQAWEGRCGEPAYEAHLLQPQPAPLLDRELGDISGGGFAMQAAQLDVAAYLHASRAAITCETMVLDWQRDVTFGAEGVSVGERRARRLISCEGYGAARNPYFSHLPFNAAKGDILTVRFHRPLPPTSLHCGIWVAPTADSQIFKVGSTYDWENLDHVPSTSARAEIEGRLKEFFHVPYTVLEHRAAVRPIISESRSYVGLHPQYERLGFFNGLGSKGALQAPWYARAFTDFLVGGMPLPGDIDIRKLLEP